MGGTLRNLLFAAGGAACTAIGWGVLAGIGAIGAVIGVIFTAAARGLYLQARWNARTHPICDLVLKPLL
ncbi:hypothetical protein ACFZC6_42800 [Streptomyces ossamyceticus]|uniref:Uncharacterized protein n=1 Tax=Streptomyces ossamyceticus TaxID=249581 RepID=A0ABV2UY90_9ACTN